VQLVLSSESLDDLEDIYTYSLSMWGREQADKYRSHLFSALSLLEDQPELGRVLAGYPLATRVLRVEQHNAFYRIDGEVIRVLRVAHLSQNLVPELT
jgi:toxin ParE1/3/4